MVKVAINAIFLIFLNSFGQDNYCTVDHQQHITHITNVSIGNINNSTQSEHYTLNASPIADLGQTTNITVTTASNNANQDTLSIFIDWNQDDDFFDEEERAIAQEINGVLNAQINVPLGKLEGQTRMRIRVAHQFGEPCGLGPYTGGEVEDYTVNVTWSKPKVLNMKSPNGGETFQAKEKVTLTWETNEPTSQVQLQYKIDGSNWMSIVNNLSNTNSYEWTLPDTAGTFNVRVGSSSGQNFDSSDVSFEVVALTVFSPNGGEQLNAGTVHNITWGVDKSFPQVHIQYTTTGTRWTLVASDLPNNGSYAWTVPDAPSTNAKIRIISSTGQRQDASDSAFTIITSTSGIVVPFKQGPEFYVQGKRSGTISLLNWETLQIKDLTGSVVKSISFSPGNINWDGRTKTEKFAAPGVYLAEFVNGTQVKSLSFILKP